MCTLDMMQTPQSYYYANKSQLQFAKTLDGEGALDRDGDRIVGRERELERNMERE